MWRGTAIVQGPPLLLLQGRTGVGAPRLCGYPSLQGPFLACVSPHPFLRMYPSCFAAGYRFFSPLWKSVLISQSNQTILWRVLQLPHHSANTEFMHGVLRGPWSLQVLCETIRAELCLAVSTYTGSLLYPQGAARGLSQQLSLYFFASN